MHIQKLAELAANLAHHANVLKADGFVKVNTGLIAGHNPSDNGMQPYLFTLSHRRFNQLFTNTLPSLRRQDIQ
jgi:hypothetical protein